MIKILNVNFCYKKKTHSQKNVSYCAWSGSRENLKELERDCQECTWEFTEILNLAQSLSNCRY